MTAHTTDTKVSIILAFYNDVVLLRLVLNAIATDQTHDLEVIIADDGSSQESVTQVTNLLRDYTFPIIHLWQPDDGFGKTIILNKAVVKASGDLLIFMDADCVPQKNFVADHLGRAGLGFCQVGRRVNVFRDAIHLLDCTEPQSIIANNFLKILWWSLTNRANHFERGIRLPLMVTNKLSKTHWGIVGCNFSLHKTDLLAINGFDERFRVQWGAEDSDIQRRLLMNGIKLQSLTQRACQIHFDAAFFARKNKTKTVSNGQPDYLKRVAEENRSFTPYGIIKSETNSYEES